MISDCCGAEMIPPDEETAKEMGSLAKAYLTYICKECGEVCKPRKGLLERIKGAKSGDYKATESEYRDMVKKLFTGMASAEPIKRQFWLFEDAVKMFHEKLGDEGFYEMLHNVELVTNVKGAEYVENFVEQYEKDNPEPS